MEREGVPRIGNDVFIGAGAKILGPVTVGDGAIVAANSLVLTNVPPGATAVGVPARMLNYTGRGGAVPGAKRNTTTPNDETEPRAQ
jgi:serine O-acetyltransferase